jgi:hypothetical protein
MDTASLPSKAREAIFQDAIRRDGTTARRAALLELLWNERFLTRAQLIVRVERRLGRDCFGKAAWEDNFYRDLRLVKQAFITAGFQLAFIRNKRRGGYYLKGQPDLSPQLDQILKSCVAEVDPRQIDVYRRLAPAVRFRQGCAISDAARNAVAYRIRRQNPGLSAAEATRLALQRAYA